MYVSSSKLKKVERMNITLKEILTKYPLETGGNWSISCLMTFSESSVPLLRFTTYEIVYGWPFPMIPWVQARLLPDCLTPTSESLKGLQLTLDRFPWTNQVAPPVGYRPPYHVFQPGDAVLVCHFKTDQLDPRRKGPYIMILWTPIAIKVAGISAWVQHSHLKNVLEEPREARPPEVESDRKGPLEIKLSTVWLSDITELFLLR